MRSGAFIFHVREGGFEPPRPFGHCDLNAARLPFRHSRVGPANCGVRAPAFAKPGAAPTTDREASERRA